MYCKVNDTRFDKYFLNESILANNKVEKSLCITFPKKQSMDKFCDGLYRLENITVGLYDDKDIEITKYSVKIVDCVVSKYTDDKESRLYISCIMERS